MNHFELQQAISSFRFNAKPKNINPSAPATVEDIQRLIDEIAKLAEAIARSVSD